MTIKFKDFLLLPNLLSLLRIFIIVPIVYLIVFEDPRLDFILISLSLIIIATDYFDGYFSRKFNQVTELGIVLDPIADKIAMGVILFILVLYRNFPLTLVILLIYRDLLIIVFGTYILKKTKTPTSANIWGKLNTTIISFTALLFLLRIDNIITTLFLILGYFIIFVSGIIYFRVGEKILKPGKIRKYLLRSITLLSTIIVIMISINIELFGVQVTDKKYLQIKNIELTQKYSPILYFVTDEPFYPIDVSSFIENSILMNSSWAIFFDQEIDKGRAFYNHIEDSCSYNYYLKIDRNLFESVSKMYNSIKNKYKPIIYTRILKYLNAEHPKYFIQYWLFFWGSNLGSTNILWHECDWEMFMIQLDENFVPEKIGLSQHYYGEVFAWNQIEKNNTHPAIYVSYGGHALYSRKGKFSSYLDKNKLLQLGSDYCSKDIKWNPNDYNLEVISDSTNWVKFEGSWGIPITTHLKGPRYRNPKDLNLTMWTNPYDWFKKFEKE